MLSGYKIVQIVTPPPGLVLSNAEGEFSVVCLALVECKETGDRHIEPITNVSTFSDEKCTDIFTPLSEVVDIHNECWEIFTDKFPVDIRRMI